MNGMELLKMMDLTEPQYVEAADSVPGKQRSVWIPLVTVAACLCFVITALLLTPQSKPGIVQPLTKPAIIWYTEPAIHPDWDPQYNDAESYSSGAALYIPGYYTQELTDSQLKSVLPESLSGHGKAGFDENGKVVDVLITIEAMPPVGVALDLPRDYVVDGDLILSTCGEVTYTICRWVNDDQILLMADGRINGVLCSFTLETNPMEEKKAKLVLEHILWEYANMEENLDLSVIVPE